MPAEEPFTASTSDLQAGLFEVMKGSSAIYN